LLYVSDAKFHRLGLATFDQEIAGAVDRVPDEDGHRVEIEDAAAVDTWAYAFTGEQFTPKNTRTA
jgi:peptide methionine sulfoxide reductase msrA/msrB